MVDLTRDKDGRTRARLLDLVPGRSGTVYADWLHDRGDPFRKRVEIATLDPFHGYKNAIDDQLADAVRGARRVPRREARHPGCRRGPSPRPARHPRPPRPRPATRCTGSATSCAPVQEHLTERQTDTASTKPRRRRPTRRSVGRLAMRPTRPLRLPPAQTRRPGRRLAEKILASFPSCPIPEIARLGRTLRTWRDAFLGYFTTSGANNGGTEAIKCRRRHLIAYADVWVMPTVGKSSLVNVGCVGGVVGIVAA